MGLSGVRIGLIKRLIDLNEKIFFERRLRKFFRRQGRIATVIDVGANKGQSIDFFLKLNPQCVIYAIEPNPDLFAGLTKKYRNNPNIKLFNIGVSDKSGEKLFFENVFDYTSSFEELNMESKYLEKKARVLGVQKENNVKKSYFVNVITLSLFIKENNLPPVIDVVKIDTEGHEYFCLTGLFSEKVAPLIKFIQLENHNDDMYANRIKFTQINEMLNQHHFFECEKIRHGFGDFDEVVYASAVK